MPIRQLKRKKDEQSSTSFSTHSFGQSREKTPDRVPSFRSAPYDFLRRVPMQRLKERRSGRGMRVSRSFMWWLLRAGLIVFFLGGIFMISIFAWYSKDLPDPNKIIDRDVAQSTKIYDRIGETLLYEIHGTERRTLIELTDIPQYAIDATVAVEDKNFFKHKGLSATGIVRAITLEILSKLHLFNRVVPGGSTLTQQFIKNAVLTREKSYVRKIKEFVLAYRLEQKFTKDEILKLYFNEIPYGSTAYGIEAAAGIYFDKPAHDLTLAEAAVLAALPQAPSYYSPYGSHKDELIARQRFILKLMVEQEYITDEQAEDARNQEIVFKKRREDIKAPHFVFMVKEELSQRYGERLVEQGGLKIITTLDAEKQKVAEEVITEKA
ncbi:MAG: transglycosylase domain-containing protein, partial [Patescibacteria group bacterium]